MNKAHKRSLSSYSCILYNSDIADQIYLLDWSTIDDGGLLIIEHLTELFKDCISYLRCDYPVLEKTIAYLLTYSIMNFSHRLTARTDYAFETTNASLLSNLAYHASPGQFFMCAKLLNMMPEMRNKAVLNK